MSVSFSPEKSMYTVVNYAGREVMLTEFERDLLVRMRPGGIRFDEPGSTAAVQYLRGLGLVRQEAWLTGVATITSEGENFCRAMEDQEKRASIEREVDAWAIRSRAKSTGTSEGKLKINVGFAPIGKPNRNGDIIDPAGVSLPAGFDPKSIKFVHQPATAKFHEMLKDFKAGRAECVGTYDLSPAETWRKKQANQFLTCAIAAKEGHAVSETRFVFCMCGAFYYISKDHSKHQCPQCNLYYVAGGIEGDRRHMTRAWFYKKATCGCLGDLDGKCLNKECPGGFEVQMPPGLKSPLDELAANTTRGSLGLEEIAGSDTPVVLDDLPRLPDGSYALGGAGVEIHESRIASGSVADPKNPLSAVSQEAITDESVGYLRRKILEGFGVPQELLTPSGVEPASWAAAQGAFDELSAMMFPVQPAESPGGDPVHCKSCGWEGAKSGATPKITNGAEFLRCPTCDSVVWIGSKPEETPKPIKFREFL